MYQFLAKDAFANENRYLKVLGKIQIFIQQLVVAKRKIHTHINTVKYNKQEKAKICVNGVNLY